MNKQRSDNSNYKVEFVKKNDEIPNILEHIYAL